ncbi:aspartyl/glutamyl-tRNA(Asn/Gln) amidotransferase, A subunit [Helicocarpus griseus UAMH5409]|uniref:Glutamyl-tRNA(Gln) amidotransferase subunit A, mitochondrial n=1 Tax=Helicocarpus griseus UAMH5409 TaxID=1447875 RepID=A0A2B7Y7N4_9EURO|nr:aspartyl/glutamyl-tRNA(Asn/Gln) amidotransferase, A subunit [Helicocarpus griseus UAMH5409]
MSLLREAEKCLANQKTCASLNAFITPLQQSGPWRERVREAESRREKGTPKSPLDGRLIAIKDNICTRDMPTTCASKMLESYTSPFNATVVQLLENAGAIVAGKTNMDEFGMGSHSMYSHFGPVVNLTECGKEKVSAGGSSGGSAVAVATEQCYAALGTDTGGSVRLPAAYTGTVGFKPSYGFLSRFGVVAYANSLDTVGIHGSNISTIRNIFHTLNHYDHHDPTSHLPPTRARLASYAHPTSRPLRIGVPTEYNINELSPPVRAAWHRTLAHLQSTGATIHPVSLPTTEAALAAYYVLAPAEASSNLSRYDGIRFGTRNPKLPDNAGPGGYLYAHTRGRGFGKEVQRRILLGTLSLSADAMENYFLQAQRVRARVRDDFDQVFARGNPFIKGDLESGVVGGAKKGLEDGVDVLVAPTAAGRSPTINEVQGMGEVEGYVGDVFTVPASLAGLPAVSVPVRVEGEGMHEVGGRGSVGMQIIGQVGDDEVVLRVGEVVEGMDGKGT